MLGLKRGTNILCAHERSWEDEAARTIERLSVVFGAAAADIQHIGGTAVVHMKAEPIIDIAVAVDSLDDIEPLIPALARAGFMRERRNGAPEIFLAREEDGRVTHRVHVVEADSAAWRDYINFRDYLNAKPSAAKAYEKAYTDGEEAFISAVLRKADGWSYLGKIVDVTVDRPLGSAHPSHGDLVYPVNYGYIDGLVGGDGEALDAYILGVDQPVSHFTGRVIGVIYREDDSEDKLVVVPEGKWLDQTDIYKAVHFQERFFKISIDHLYHKSCGMIVFRINEGGIEFLLLHEMASNKWSFPKGHMEPGESELQTAQREVEEEAGIRPEVITGFRAEISYRIAPVYEKTVVLFLARSSGKIRIKADEIDAYCWAEPAQAKEKLRHVDASVLDQAERWAYSEAT